MSYNALSLIGNCHLAPLASAGAQPTYFFDSLNATALTINPGALETKRRLGKGRDNNGSTLNSFVLVTKGASITIGNDEFTPDFLAIQLRGAKSALSAAGGAVADESVVVKLDQYVPLLKSHFTSAPVTATADPGPTPAYTENTHFVMNRRMGWIKFLSGVAGAPTDGASVLVSYTESAWTGTRVGGSVGLPNRYLIKFDGVNQASGKNCIVLVPQGIIAPDGNLEAITDAFSSGNLIVTPELAAGQTASYYYDEDE
ncbi:MAG TPA: hypothetical protein PKY50_06120 [Candidatus Competibacter sp.]|nr:hypothetical protein [Candidatus Competibacter sp.]